jgi:3-(3-hydroxy-phenyl)propionate hydroxylase/6-hydroxy-3-succinoylpyridine 3-monooxygenase
MHDVIVVGGGPTGFVTALGLAQGRGQRVPDRGRPAIISSPRACVYHWSMLDGLERLGIREEAERIGYTKDDYLWLVKKTGERLEYDISVVGQVTPYPYNIQLGQDRLAEICLARLEAMPNAEVHWRTPSPACHRMRKASRSAPRAGRRGRAAGPLGDRRRRARAVRCARRSASASTE